MYRWSTRFLLISCLIFSWVVIQWAFTGGVLPSVSPAQAETLESAPDAKVPKAVFPETKHEFEPVNEGTEIKYDFVVENHGQAPLVIERVQPD